MAITVTNAFIKSYTQYENKRHEAYKKTVDIYNHLRFHIDGYVYDKQSLIEPNPYFERLIGEYRPGEDRKVKEFRKSIYTSVSMQPCFKVINSLKKIIKSEDWQINYDKSKTPPSIREGETLEDYAEEKYPKRLKSIQSWFYQFGMRTLLTDPNAVVYTIPLNTVVSDTDYIKPFTNIANSPNVYDYVSDELAVILSTEKSQYTYNGKLYTNGKIVYVFQRGVINKATQIDFDGNFRIDVLLNEPDMPIQAYRAGFGEAIGVIGNETIYDSFMSPMLPFLDKMARENSDLDAAVVRHLHPREWEFSTIECSRCKGAGEVIYPGGAVTCTDCKGSGQSLKSPFTTLVVKAGTLGDNPTPTPPAGIVPRDNAIIEIQDRRVQEHGLNALATLNMEFLGDSPLNQSGVAKEVDRDELNNYVFGVAQNLVDIQMLNVYKQNAQQRYWRVTRGNEETIEDMLPFIPVPTKYDLLSENTVVDKLKKMNDSGVDPTIISEVQRELTNKMFSQDVDTKKKLNLIFALNPFTGSNVDEIQNALLAGTATKRDAVLSQYVEQFVKTAISNNNEFLEMEFEEQKSVVLQLLDAKISELTVTSVPITTPDGNAV